MNEDHLPSLSESEKEEIQDDSEVRYNTGTLRKRETQRGYIIGATLERRRAKKREAELLEAAQAVCEQWDNHNGTGWDTKMKRKIAALEAAIKMT